MTKLAQLIAKEEGFFRSGTLPAVRHNPGDLRHSPHSQHPGGLAHKDDIGTIGTDADGWADLDRQLHIFADLKLTLAEAIYRWAPPSDGNDTSRYLSDVIAGFHGGVPAVVGSTPLAVVLTIQA